MISGKQWIFAISSATGTKMEKNVTTWTWSKGAYRENGWTAS